MPLSSPVWIEVLETALNSVLLPLLGMPTSAMRSRRSPRKSGVRSRIDASCVAFFIKQ
ncbi:MAG: hypothetical protein OEM48_09175 [Gammaproteobacteria bacterium]|nr:hypothetical protein [Gammaproteobacteria bacterium]